MAQLKLGAAGVTANEIDISGPVVQQPVGIPAGIVGTAKKGPAFVPITVGTIDDFTKKFGNVTSEHFGPLAVREWLRNAQAVTYLRVLGVGDGKKRQPVTSNNPGSVANAGFVVGESLPSGTLGKLDSNPYANLNGDPGRTYFLGCLMSESAGSTYFSDAGLQTLGQNVATPIIRGVVMAASGVILRLSSSLAGVTSNAPASTLVAVTGSALPGSHIGTVDKLNGGQQFVMLLAGHKGVDQLSPNVLTASFDPNSNSYFGTVFNKDPLKIQEKGHVLYSQWDIHPAVAALTGVGLISASFGADADGAAYGGHSSSKYETGAFIITSSLDRSKGTATVPNFESFEDRFGSAKTPWVVSQKFGGKPQNLFRFHALDAGSNISESMKISIKNIEPSSDPSSKYGRFVVGIRDWRDTDKNIQLLEQEFLCDLNPLSPNYIAKKIGDLHVYYDFDRDDDEQKLVVEGDYPNRSNYIRVEVHEDVINGFVDPTALPLGFRGPAHLMTSGSAVFPLLPASAAGDGSQNGGILNLSTLRQAVTPPVPLLRKTTNNQIGSVFEQASNEYYWGPRFGLETNPLKPNENPLTSYTVNAFAKYYPDFSTTNMNFVEGDNAGAADTAANGIIDSDRFCNNFFSLENIQVVTASVSENGATLAANPDRWVDAVYVRNGVIPTNDATATRAFKLSDVGPGKTSNRAYAKFSMFFQGGFNGVNIFDSDESKLNNNAVSSDMIVGNGRLLNDGPNVKAYQKAIDIMKNVSNLDVQLLAIPGIRNPIITDYATVATEERFDALYIMDIEQYQMDGVDSTYEVRKDSDIVSVTNTLSSFTSRDINSSFAAAYFPDILYQAPDKNVYVPPSVLVLGALALNDAVGHPWFAPAGFTRGALPVQAQEARVKLKTEDLDSLYNERVNPLVAFAGSSSGLNPAGGLVVWGQKTLQLAASALDRVNVRRLLIEIRRQVRDIAQTIIFEPNKEATLAAFTAAVTPRLQRIQALAGLERFRVIIDASTTTQQDIELNTVRGKIFVQPTKSIEFVSLDFVVANNLQQVAFNQ
jgi:hypothetical protein